MDKLELTIRADYVGIAGLFRSSGENDDARVLSGVHVLPMTDGGGVAIIAMNGYSACIMRDRRGRTAKPATLRVSDAFLEVCMAYDEEDAGRRMVTTHSGRLAVSIEGGEELFVQPNPSFLGGGYPKMEFLGKFLAEMEPGVEAPLMSAHGLHTAMKAFASMADITSSLGGVQMIHGSPRNAVLFRLVSRDDMLVVCMPIAVEWDEGGDELEPRKLVLENGPLGWLANIPGALGTKE